jgi:hypothetical protein
MNPLRYLFKSITFPALLLALFLALSPAVMAQHRGGGGGDRSFQGQRGFSGRQFNGGGRIQNFSGRSFDGGRDGGRRFVPNRRGYWYGFYGVPYYGYGGYGYYYPPRYCNPAGYYDYWGYWHPDPRCGYDPYGYGYGYGY